MLGPQKWYLTQLLDAALLYVANRGRVSTSYKDTVLLGDFNLDYSKINDVNYAHSGRFADFKKEIMLIRLLTPLLVDAAS